MRQISVLLQHEWSEKLIEDGMFNDIENPNKWLVNENNEIEFIEALNLESYFNEDEVR
jgi:hypothetical protein